jgi:signal transduction histidine kinase
VHNLHVPQTAMLIRFMRSASDAVGGEQLLPLLAETTVTDVGVDGVVVVGVGPDGAPRVAVARGAAASLVGHAFETDVIDSSVGAELLAASGGAFRTAHTRPLVSGHDLFGALVLLSRAKDGITEAQLELANALGDAAAMRLESAAQLEQMRAKEEALARSEKLRALGQMASGIVHDLKNILNPIALHLQLAKRALAKEQMPKALESCDEIHAIVKRGVEVLERLREFSRQAPERAAERADLARIASEAISIARPRMAAKSDVRCVIHEELASSPEVNVHVAEVVSAIVNLVANAIDAMPKGGNITVRTGEEDGGAFVTVKDDGPGMPPDVEKRVFEPFFTTKGQEGTGLGLAMVYACMQRHGGRVTLKTAPGKGAAFTLWFPSAPAG